MGLLFGYLSNDFSLVRSAFSQVENALAVAMPDKRLNWGLSYVQNGQVLLRKNPDQPGESFQFAPLVDDLRSHCIVGSAGEHRTARSGSDIPPYRFREWLLAHDGDPLNITSYRGRLLGDLPDYVASNIGGDHPAEVLLHFFVERVRRAVGRSSQALASKNAARALAESIVEVKRMAHESGAEAPPVLNVLFTNGTLMVVSCFGAPMHYVVLEGIYDDPIQRPEPLFAGHRTKRVDHPTFRAVFFAAGIAETTEIWRPMRDGTVAYVDRNHIVQVEGFDALLSPEH